MISIGTLCYVVTSCLASPATARAVGKSFEGWTFYCRSDKLMPLSDPGADVGDWQDDPAPARADQPKQRA